MSPAPNMSPLHVFQPAANQRLSCRKITCKAFPFVVEEHRVTSYFFLVKRKNRCAVGDLVDLSLIYLPPTPPFYLRLVVEICAALPVDFSPLFAGVTWLEAVGRSLKNGACLWNKKVNLLVDCFAGCECFQPPLFMALSLWLLKEKECI
ncbi:hypothetical protein XENOCAPTIV_007575 [Xenoophorus captivus]|uniref:Uncharacterized protein n=1 Tax=Xenoophorus captivus TaxID=1517983 RepID=A0ABV0RDW1_9TELE